MKLKIIIISDINGVFAAAIPFLLTHDFPHPRGPIIRREFPSLDNIVRSSKHFTVLNVREKIMANDTNINNNSNIASRNIPRATIS